ncbi:hypothetical protein [Bacillus sp. FJAT-29937]|uniref:hypothetical protein n=1 Tax=Bacillus sp. FJAT-29937 TaxID=1720553 RepID=UPI00082B8616|nr:hypothetical protein [Bacillus sp. FJAT-29937]
MSLISYHWRVKDFLDSKKKGISYVASADGQIYEVRDSEIGRMVAKPTKIQTLDSVEVGFQFRLPKIPESIFHQIYSFFKYYCDLSDVEVMLQLFFDKETKQYFLECPVQHVSKTRVNAQEDIRFLGRNSLRYIQVAQFHSHNSMSAYFSEVDDLDEKAYMIYGVFGLLNQDRPSVRFRVKANDTYLYLNGEDIFESLSFQKINFPREWVERVISK